MSISKDLLAHALGVLTVAIWGTTFVSTKYLIGSGLHVAEVFVLRFLIAYACVWLISPRRLWADTLKDEGLFVLLGITGGSLYFMTENIAVGLTYVNNVSFIVCTAPLITMLLARVFTHSLRMRRRLVAGSVLALVGVAVVIFNGHFVLKLNPSGDLIALAAAVCWAVYSLLIKKVSGSYSAVFVTRKVFAYGILTILPYFAARGWSFPLQGFANPVVYGNMLFLGLIASFACFMTWSWVVHQIGALKTANYVYLNPVTTVVASALFLDEPMTALAYAGSVLILVGVFMANSAPIEER